MNKHHKVMRRRRSLTMILISKLQGLKENSRRWQRAKDKERAKEKRSKERKKKWKMRQKLAVKCKISDKLEKTMQRIKLSRDRSITDHCLKVTLKDIRIIKCSVLWEKLQTLFLASTKDFQSRKLILYSQVRKIYLRNKIE